jgi:hypothetical protein
MIFSSLWVSFYRFFEQNLQFENLIIQTRRFSRTAFLHSWRTKHLNSNHQLFLTDSFSPQPAFQISWLEKSRTKHARLPSVKCRPPPRHARSVHPKQQKLRPSPRHPASRLPLPPPTSCFLRRFYYCYAIAYIYIYTPVVAPAAAAAASTHPRRRRSRGRTGTHSRAIAAEEGGGI